MIKDISNMSKAEVEAKFKVINQKIKEENARFGLPITGYSTEHKCIVHKYIDGRVEKATTLPKPEKVLKSQLSSGY